MRTITVIVEKAPNNLAAYVEGIDGVVAVGSDIAELQKHMYEALEIYKQTCIEEGYDVPEELQGEYVIEFRQSLPYPLPIQD